LIIIQTTHKAAMHKTQNGNRPLPGGTQLKRLVR
jgi:hypothetical protein